MKTTNFTRKNLLGIALLGTFALAPLTLTASAQPGPPRGPEARRPEPPRPPHGKGPKAPKPRKDDRDRNDRNRNDRDRNDRDRNDRDYRDRYDRDRYDRDRDYRDRYDSDSRNRRNNASYSGTVTSVRGNGFDLRANGRTYNVYLSSGLPRGLDRGDEVRVYGRPYGDNDIRNASVRITRNR